MSIQKKLIEKLFSTEHLNIEERKMLEKDSLKIQFIADVLESHLEKVKVIPSSAMNLSENNDLPRLHEGCCLERKGSKYFIHTFGFHGEKNEKAYRNLLPALKDYMNLAYQNNIDGIYILPN